MADAATIIARKEVSSGIPEEALRLARLIEETERQNDGLIVANG